MGSTTTNVLITPLLPNPPYDPAKDFSAVTVFAYSSTSIVINASMPARTLKELIDYAKANPRKLSYGSAGNGSITNLAGELFKQRAGGLDIVRVPSKGIGQDLSSAALEETPRRCPEPRSRWPCSSARPPARFQFPIRFHVRARRSHRSRPII